MSAERMLAIPLTAKVSRAQFLYQEIGSSVTRTGWLQAGSARRCIAADPLPFAPIAALRGGPGSSGAKSSLDGEQLDRVHRASNATRTGGCSSSVAAALWITAGSVMGALPIS